MLRLARRGALQPRHRLGDMGLVGGGVGGEQLDDFGVALVRRHVDGCLARRREEADINLRVAQEKPRRLGVAVARREVQRCPPLLLRRSVDVEVAPAQ